jgi:Rap1a immunity proteins
MNGKNHIFRKFIQGISVFAFGFMVTATPFSAPRAQYLAGQDLLLLCLSEDQDKVFSCLNYIAGVIDYHIVMQSLGTTPTIDFCLPAKMPIEDAAVTVMRYLKKSPQHQAFIAAPAVTLALHEVFPCAPLKKKTKSKSKK